MNLDESLLAMKQMVSEQNWQGYLHFRRDYVLNGGKKGAISNMIRSLSDAAQMAYGHYFGGNSHEISSHIRAILSEERELKFASLQAERQAAYEQSLKEQAKPIKRKDSDR